MSVLSDRWIKKMAIEKQIDLEEAITSVKMPTADKIERLDTGEVEVEIADDATIEAAEAMGFFDEEEQLTEDFDANLAEQMPEEDLQFVANELYEGFTKDKDSRQEYDDIAEEGVTLLGFKDDQGGEPFPGACNATHPVLEQAVVKFKSIRLVSFAFVIINITPIIDNIIPKNCIKYV